MITADQLKDVVDRVEKLHHYLKIDQKRVEFEEESLRTQAELQLAFDYYKENIVTEQEVDDDYARSIKNIEALELRNMLRQEEDAMDAVMKINSGAGGTESQDWAQMLMRMYQRWSEDHGYKVTISDIK